MHVVAGPPGSGKSSLFPLRGIGFDFFNIDDRCAELNGGSYLAIAPEIRKRANAECEAFIEAHIRDGVSFAVETTLRTDITFRQAAQARERGFALLMEFVATASAEENVERVAIRADAGGQSAPPAQIRETYAVSLANLARALREFDVVTVYDNSSREESPTVVMIQAHGKVRFRSPNLPAWAASALPPS